MVKTLTITKVKMPKNKISIKCPYSMTPSSITRHDTYNDASAMSEISYMIRNNREVSFHYAVDDYRAVEGIVPNRNSWSNGDGSKSNGGNRTSISVEVCYSKSGGERYTKAADNALTLIATLMKRYGIPSTRIFFHRHWSGKKCPHRLIDMGISERQYQKMVQARYNEMYGGGNAVNTITKPTTGVSYHVGDVVTIDGVYTSSSSNQQLKPSKTKGKITKIVKGARNPYLLENGNIGWVNDDCITSGGSTSSNNSSSTGKGGYKVGDTVTINGVYTSSTSGKKLNPSRTKGKITKIISGAKNPYLLENGDIGWTNDKCIISGKSNSTSYTYYPKYNGSSDSISTALSVVGVDNSYSNRAKIAAVNGIKNYSGTAKQNTDMLNALKKGRLIKSKK